MKVHGMKFASLGPFKVVFEPVTFQRLCACLHGCERGKTALASAGAFKFAPAATRMPKESVSLSCSFGLFGLSGLYCVFG